MGNQRAVCEEDDNCSFRHDMNKRGKVSPSNPSPKSFMQQNDRKGSRTRSPRGKSPSGRMSRWPCKDYLKGTCNNSFCEKWHPPECLFYKTKSGCRFGEKCSYAHRQVDEQPIQKSKKNDDKKCSSYVEEVLIGYESVGNLLSTMLMVTIDQVRPDKKRDHKLERRQLGCVFQDMTPPKSYSPEEHNNATNRTC